MILNDGRRPSRTLTHDGFVWRDDELRHSAGRGNLIIDLRLSTPTVTLAGDEVIRGELVVGDDRVIDLDLDLDPAQLNGSSTNGSGVNGSSVKRAGLNGSGTSGSGRHETTGDGDGHRDRDREGDVASGEGDEAPAPRPRRTRPLRATT